jgi:hypothetical protein
VVEAAVSLWDDPKFREPTDAVGDWHVVRRACFEHEDAPSAAKYAVEKMTKQLLQREPLDRVAPVLRYAGTSGAGGYPSTVRLELVAVGGGRHLYALTSEGTAPRRWEDEQHFTAMCERRFERWCAQLRIVADQPAWPGGPRSPLEPCVIQVVAAEEAAERVGEDMAPVFALQARILDALRGGAGFVEAGKEGRTQLFFDGTVFRREDDGDGPDRSAAYADDASMLDCLRHHYDWEANQGSYPHPQPELVVWQYIQARLRAR